jgi:hypothetical protein
MPGPSADTVDAVDSAQGGAISKFSADGGISQSDYRAQVDATLRRLLKDSEVRVRVTPDVLSKILDDGRFRSQFETSTSGGALAPEYRASVERTMFGYPTDLPPAQRPIYGYMSGSVNEKEGMVGQYGSVIVRLKDAAKQRATVSLMDSLGPGERKEMLPSPATDPSHRSIYWRNFSGDPLRGGKLSYEKPVTPTLENLSNYYAEAQIHGGLSLDDVAEVVLNRSELESAERVAQDAVAAYQDQIARGEQAVNQALADRRMPTAAAIDAITTGKTYLEQAQARLRQVEGQASALRARLDAAGIKATVVDSFADLP